LAGIRFGKSFGLQLATRIADIAVRHSQPFFKADKLVAILVVRFKHFARFGSLPTSRQIGRAVDAPRNSLTVSRVTIASFTVAPFSVAPVSFAPASVALRSFTIAVASSTCGLNVTSQRSNFALELYDHLIKSRFAFGSRLESAKRAAIRRSTSGISLWRTTSTQIRLG